MLEHLSQPLGGGVGAGLEVAYRGGLVLVTGKEGGGG